ncbi:hypothetical protein NIES23_12790 [Trichormus variabilis NIES-23]|uniref:Uncharacterized protein n=1 Tax=Trichormus variabilis NIES-23 TaxID=1973479 RepID=A0A1Z4KHZ2_ANAVA|nr:hypothetical protein NIES23_12790 [Trichormus variabilis NIES-23]
MIAFWAKFELDQVTTLERKLLRSTTGDRQNFGSI